MDLIFNLRIWKLHFQIERSWSCKPIFAWYDFWVGIFFDTKKAIKTTYIFPIPMFGIKLVGFAIHWNSNYSFRRDPFIWLFQFGKHYRPMREYDSWMHSNAGGVVSNSKTSTTR